MSEPWDLAKAKQLRESGWTFNRVGQLFGVTGDTLKCWLDPRYANLRRERVNLLRRMRCGHHEQKAITFINTLGSRKAPEADVAARMAEIPADTRSLTQRLMGDPLPGRDALSRATNHTERA